MDCNPTNHSFLDRAFLKTHEPRFFAHAGRNPIPGLSHSPLCMNESSVCRYFAGGPWLCLWIVVNGFLGPLEAFVNRGGPAALIILFWTELDLILIPFELSLNYN